MAKRTIENLRDENLSDDSFQNAMNSDDGIDDQAKENNPPEKAGTYSRKQEQDAAPVIVYGIKHELIDDIKRLEEIILKSSDNAEITKIKIDKNKNLLIFPKTVEDAKKIETNTGLFPNCKKLNLNLTEYKPAIIIRGLNYESACSYYEKLKTKGIIAITNLKNKHEANSIDPKIVKATCDSVETKNRLLKENIILGFQQFKTEPHVRTPPQCKNCKQFNHYAINCSIDVVCGLCAGNHMDENCTSLIKKCVNCNDLHSSYYRGCPKFQRLKKEAIQKYYEKNTQPTTSNATSTRIYSDFVKANNNLSSGNQSNLMNSSIVDKIDKLDGKISNLNDNFETKITNINTNINTAIQNLSIDFSTKCSEFVSKNNEKISLFVFDVVSSLLDNSVNNQELLINKFNQSYIKHNLGNNPVINYNPSGIIHQNSITQPQTFNQNYNSQPKSQTPSEFRFLNQQQSNPQASNYQLPIQSHASLRQNENSYDSNIHESTYNQINNNSLNQSSSIFNTTKNRNA